MTLCLYCVAMVEGLTVFREENIGNKCTATIMNDEYHITLSPKYFHK